MKTVSILPYGVPAASSVCLLASLVVLVSLPRVARAQMMVKVPEAGLTLQVPTGSTIVTRQTPGALTKHSPGWVMDVIGPTEAGFRTNFNLRTGVAQPGAAYSLSSASKMSGQFRQGYPNSRNLTFTTLTVGGEKAVAVAGTIPMPKQVIRTKIVQFARAGTRYTFTFTSPESAFYRHVGTFDKAVASIRWL